MRDIIFRGKRVGYNDWVYGNRIHDDVINRDCYLFSCAYRIIRDDGAYLVYHTPCNRFEFKYMEDRE